MRALARPADVLLYRVTPRSNLVAKLIAFAEAIIGSGSIRHPYYHVSILASNTDYQIEAVWPRVRKSKVDWSRTDIELRRFEGMDAYKAAGALIIAEGAIGKRYDLGQLLFGWLGSRHEYICTELVQKAAAKAGYWIPGDFLTPNDLAAFPMLWKVAP